MIPSVLKWISPVISQKEVESLVLWVNTHLTQVGAEPISNSRALKVMPVIDATLPDAIEILFPLQFKDFSHSEKFREAVWTETLAGLLPEPTPFALSLLPLTVAQTKKRLVVFDMDSTMINQEVIDEIARTNGLYDQIAAITEEAMQGKLDFKASLTKRCGLLKGMPFAQANSIIPSLSVSPGGEDFIKSLRSQHIRTAIVSGGFDFVLKHFQKQLFIDQVHGHHLTRDDDDVLTGSVELPIIDGEQKKVLVARMKQEYGAKKEETITVGDGANDIPMMSEAGMSVSFCGKPKLSAMTNTLILHRNLLWIKHLL